MAAQRLDKIIASTGRWSRREVKDLVRQGRVTVDGGPARSAEEKADPEQAVIAVNGEKLNWRRYTWVMLNKPAGYLSATEDGRGATVLDLLPQDLQRQGLFPVGRLDKDTEGLLLLTNDGDLASKLTHPKYLKKKIYHVYCDKNVTKADLDQIVQGITLDDGEIHADAVSYASDTDKSQVGIEIHSGKNRIVRRIFESLGYRVIKLDRVYFAGLTKKGLRRGDWRYLTEMEVNMLRMGSFE